MADDADQVIQAFQARRALAWCAERELRNVAFFVELLRGFVDAHGARTGYLINRTRPSLPPSRSDQSPPRSLTSWA